MGIPSRPQKILIIKLSAIGDVVHTLPLLEVLKANHPEARIDWAVEEASAEIVRGHPLLERVLVSRRRSWQRRLQRGPREWAGVAGEVVQFVRELRLRSYDLVLDVQGLLKSGVLTSLSRAPRKLGLSEAREGAHLFFTEPPVPIRFQDHAIERYLTLSDYLGCRRVTWKGAIPVSSRDRDQADRLLDEAGMGGRPMVAINPVAKWPTKLWDTGRFARVADWLVREAGCGVLLTGGVEDRSVTRAISEQMRGEALDLAGRTGLKTLACLFQRCRALITVDTGPMHVAAAMGCPTVALFGPTDPGRTGPYGKGHRIVRARVPCSPCFRRRCRFPECMASIGVEQVTRELAHLL